MTHRKRLAAVFGVMMLPLVGAANAAETIPVGQLVAETGATAPVAKIYGQGVADAFSFINDQGGINGKKIQLATVDYGYDAAKAVSTYKQWAQSLKPVAIQGWAPPTPRRSSTSSPRTASCSCPAPHRAT